MVTLQISHTISSMIQSLTTEQRVFTVQCTSIGLRFDTQVSK
jgi:hypothetical protein